MNNANLDSTNLESDLIRNVLQLLFLTNRWVTSDTTMAGIVAGMARISSNMGKLTFHEAKARFKMNKLSSEVSLVGTDMFGNKYYEDEKESFGATAASGQDQSTRSYQQLVPNVLVSPQ